MLISGIINNSADSLFDYHEAGESWSTYYDPDFTPLFGVEFSDPAVEAEAMGLCQGNEFCLYDFATTGSMDIGLSTLNGSVSYDEMVETAIPSVYHINSYVLCCVYIVILVHIQATDCTCYSIKLLLLTENLQNLFFLSKVRYMHVAYYMGVSLSIVICNPSCVNGACIANDTCQCAMGYTGQICTEPGGLMTMHIMYVRSSLLYLFI